MLSACALCGCASSANAPNGIASQPPARVLAEAVAAAKGAATVHVAGSIEGGLRPISIDMELVSHKGAQGRVAADGLDLELVELDGLLYVKGNAAFERSVLGTPVPAQLRGRWLKGPADSHALAPLAPLGQMRVLIPTVLGEHGTLVRGGAERIDGREAIALSDPTADATLYVASTGAPYPLALIKRGAHAGRLTFDRWNQPVEVTAPSSPIDVRELRAER